MRLCYRFLTRNGGKLSLGRSEIPNWILRLRRPLPGRCHFEQPPPKLYQLKQAVTVRPREIVFHFSGKTFFELSYIAGGRTLRQVDVKASQFCSLDHSHFHLN